MWPYIKNGKGVMGPGLYKGPLTFWGKKLGGLSKRLGALLTLLEIGGSS